MTAPRRLFLSLATLAGALSTLSTPILATDLNCSTEQTISSPATFDNVVVQNGCILTVDVRWARRRL